MWKWRCCCICNELFTIRRIEPGCCFSDMVSECCVMMPYHSLNAVSSRLLYSKEQIAPGRLFSAVYTTGTHLPISPWSVSCLVFNFLDNARGSTNNEGYVLHMLRPALPLCSSRHSIHSVVLFIPSWCSSCGWGIQSFDAMWSELMPVIY